MPQAEHKDIDILDIPDPKKEEKKPESTSTTISTPREAKKLEKVEPDSEIIADHVDSAPMPKKGNVVLQRANIPVNRNPSNRVDGVWGEFLEKI